MTDAAELSLSSAAAHRNRRVVLVAIMLATFMVAVEATIVATAMPSIVGQLGGFEFYTWVFSAYLLAQCTTMLIFGKLSDTFGRRPVINAGILIFLAGSLLAGFAPSMGWLIAFRLLQGIGAGAIQPITITLIGDLYPAQERARVQGVVASVWAGAAVFGPLAGGLIVDHLAWGWVFWINLPVGLLTVAGFALFLREGAAPGARSIDYLGAALFAVANACLLLVLTATGLGPVRVAALLGTSVAAAVLFVLQELRTPEPMISIALWRRRLMAASNAASFLAGVVLVGVTTFLPLYVQGVMGRTPAVAGLTVTALVIGWTGSLVLAPSFARRHGTRRTLRIGSLSFPAGAALLLLLTPGSSPFLPAAGAMVMGIGMGLVSIISIVLVQASVEWSMRGSATSSVIFSRSLGNALGASVIGAVLTLGIAHFGPGTVGETLQRHLDEPTGLAHLVNDPGLRGVFDAALRWSFQGVLAVAVLAVVAAWLLPAPGKPQD